MNIVFIEKFNKLFIFLNVIFITLCAYNFSYSQVNNIDNIMSNNKTSIFDNWSLGVIGGFNEMSQNNSLFDNKLIGNGITNNQSIGFLAEYEFKNFNIAMQTSLESYSFKYNLNGKDANKSIYATQLGLKIYTGIVDRLYILPAIGFTFDEGQKDFMKSISLGYDFIDSPKSAYFFQIGYGDLGGTNSGMMLIKFGVRIKL